MAPPKTSSRAFNRQSVQDALRSIQAKLKTYKVPPPNGLVIFCGNCAENGWINVDIEPLKPLGSTLYYCGDKFQVDILKDQLVVVESIGIVIINGDGCSIHVLSGTTKSTIDQWKVGLPKKHNRGGQSHDRFRRIREEKRDWFVKDVIEAMTKHFIDTSTHKVTMSGIIVAGFGSLKDELIKSQHLDKRIREKIIKVLNIQSSGNTGLNEVINLASESISDNLLVQETNLLSDYMATISTDGAYTVGANDTMTCLEDGIIKTLIVWDELPLVRFEVRDRATDDVGGHRAIIGMPDMTIDGSQEIVSHRPLLEWLMDNADRFGASLRVVTNRSPPGSQFAKGLQGIGSILRYKVDVTLLDDVVIDDADEDSFEVTMM